MQANNIVTVQSPKLPRSKKAQTTKHSVDLGKILNSENFNKFNEQIENNQLPVFACDPIVIETDA